MLEGWWRCLCYVWMKVLRKHDSIIVYILYLKKEVNKSVIPRFCPTSFFLSPRSSQLLFDFFFINADRSCWAEWRFVTSYRIDRRDEDRGAGNLSETFNNRSHPIIIHSNRDTIDRWRGWLDDDYTDLQKNNNKCAARWERNVFFGLQAAAIHSVWWLSSGGWSGEHVFYYPQSWRQNLNETESNCKSCNRSGGWWSSGWVVLKLIISMLSYRNLSVNKMQWIFIRPMDWDFFSVLL